MNCKFCGRDLNDRKEVCKNCGHRVDNLESSFNKDELLKIYAGKNSEKVLYKK